MEQSQKKFWYAVYLKSRHEFKTEKKLLEKDIEVFLPIIERIRQWKDRKKVVTFPLFSGYIFINIPDDYKILLSILKTPGVVRFLTLEGKPTPIPDEQIISLKKIIENKEQINPHPYIIKGQKVRITNGPLAGVEGILMEKLNHNFLVLSIDLIKQGAEVKIDAFDIEPA
jgi:transcription elongation factor/antiterminator RfaH